MSSFLRDEPEYPTNISCSCGGCSDYLPQSNGQLECGRCGCSPLEHKYLFNKDHDDKPVPSLPAPEDKSTRIYETASLKRPFTLPSMSESLGPTSTPTPPKKKSKVELVDHSPNKSPEEGLLQMKPCKILQRTHFPVSAISDLTNKVHGVYKIAYDYHTIYVGRDSCCIKKALNAQLKGYGHAGLHAFLKGLTPLDLELVSVAWVDEEKHVHTCKKSYMKCLEALQDGKLTVPGMKKPEAKKEIWCTIL